jgi:hypothetical protein
LLVVPTAPCTGPVEAAPTLTSTVVVTATLDIIGMLNIRHGGEYNLDDTHDQLKIRTY